MKLEAYSASAPSITTKNGSEIDDITFQEVVKKSTDMELNGFFWRKCVKFFNSHCDLMQLWNAADTLKLGVSTRNFPVIRLQQFFTLIFFYTIWNALRMTLSQRIGFAGLVKSPGLLFLFTSTFVPLARTPPAPRCITAQTFPFNSHQQNTTEVNHQISWRTFTHDLSRLSSKSGRLRLRLWFSCYDTPGNFPLPRQLELGVTSHKIFIESTYVLVTRVGQEIVSSFVHPGFHYNRCSSSSICLTASALTVLEMNWYIFYFIFQ